MPEMKTPQTPNSTAGSNPGGNVRENVRDLKTTAVNTGSQLKDNLRDLKDAAGNTAVAVGHELSDQAKHAAGAVADKADDLTASAGNKMRQAADALRHKVDGGGFTGAAAGTLASALDKGGEYLQSEKLSGMAHDLGELVKKHPFPAMLVGFGLGYLLARSTRS